MSSADFGILLLACLSMCRALPIPAPTISSEDEDLAKEYISKYYSTDSGAMSPSLLNIDGTATFIENIRAMQAFFGLEVTGTLNSKTVEVMKAPRCGVPEVQQFQHFAWKPKWEKQLITYRITQYTPDLTRWQVDETIAQAFKLYSDVIPLDFKQVYWGTADIMIFFQSREHGDFSPFDGPGRQLAHAYPPGQNVGGDAHFDEDETWSLTPYNVNLLLVAAHEFGHSLGLHHSDDINALMYPTYKYVNTNGYKLPDDDRRGVQALYGSRTSTPTVRPRFQWPFVPEPRPDPVDPTPMPSPRDQQCSFDLAIDAAVSIWGDLFFFKNGYYWWKSTGFPEIRFSKVSTMWPPINYVDAACEVPHKQLVYVFQGNQYWGVRAEQKSILPGYPQPITNLGLPASVMKVDAAVYHQTLGKTLIFVDNQFWSYDETWNVMDFGSPQYISVHFSGIGSKVDAAFENHGSIYFVEGAKQRQYHLSYKTVTQELLNYEWLNCASAGNYTIYYKFFISLLDLLTAGE
ncbi:unnamed protein product [Menidia menidia]|uniref:(Atlantic silverside) hypothetical protein n=1 Tax=Menidia menidia TaxID=238744 RepID=A0A8S4BRY5_9TELE|nr:unnamed protein product [Menidia menidia]